MADLSPNRRLFLTTTIAAATGVAGCIDSLNPGNQTPETPCETADNTGSGSQPITDGWPTWKQNARNTSTTADRPPGPELVKGWEIDELQPLSRPAVASGTVYFGAATGEDDVLAAADLATGDIRWQQSLEKAPRMPTVVGDEVYAADDVGNIYALEAASGSRRWTYEAAFGEGVPTYPIVGTNLIYAQTDGGIRAFGVEAGEERWTYRPESEDGEFTEPAMAESRLYVGSSDGQVIAIDAQNGAEAWRFDTGRHLDEETATANVNASPVVVGDTVYVGNIASGVGGYETPAQPAESHLFAIRRCDGTERWRQSLGTERFLRYSPAVSDQRLVVQMDGALRAYDRSDGTEEWQLSLEYPEPAGTPTIAREGIYVSVDGKLRAYDATTGDQKWRLQGHELRSWVIAAGTVVAVSQEDALVAFDG